MVQTILFIGVLDNSPNIVRVEMNKAPLLTPTYKVTQLQLARNIMKIYQNNVGKIYINANVDLLFRKFSVMINKCKVNVPDDLNTYWRDLRTKASGFIKRNYGGGSFIMLRQYFYKQQSIKVSTCQINEFFMSFHIKILINVDIF